MNNERLSDEKQSHTFEMNPAKSSFIITILFWHIGEVQEIHKSSYFASPRHANGVYHSKWKALSINRNDAGDDDALATSKKWKDVNHEIKKREKQEKDILDVHRYQ